MNASDLFPAALAGEREALECYGALRTYFESHNQPLVAAACRNMAARHERAVESLWRLGVGGATAASWLDPEARELVLRIANARALLEMAVDLEREAQARYGALEAMCNEAEATTTMHELGRLCAENARRMEDAVEALPLPPDWERLIEAGTVPALALGAERRLRRH